MSDARRPLSITMLVLLVSSLIIVLFPAKALAYACLTGGDHLGAAWDPATACPGGFAGNHTNIGAFTIAGGETATVQAYTGALYGSAQISATSVNIANTGTLTAAGKGYLGGVTTGNGGGTGGGGGAPGGQLGAGGGYGGAGASTANATGGVTYGSYSAPVDMGSGGGSGCGGTGASGGGAIQITTSGTTTISGTVSADGNGAAGPGSGAGGSIYITTSTLTGGGSIHAGGGGGSLSGCSTAGGGGGGRIAIYYSTANTFSGAAPSVNAGGGGFGQQPGTCIIVDSTNNDLYLSTSQTWNANPTHEGSTFSYRNVTVSNSITWTMWGYNTTNTNGVGMNFTVSNFTINSGSTVVGVGYAGGVTTGNGSGPGGGTGGNGGVSGGGGGYGGAGGSSGSAGGGTYGSQASPIDLGSGGGSGCGNTGAYGGGAIRITASGTTTVAGTLNMSGYSTTGAGGGSGGSIYLTVGTLTGAGSIFAGGGSSGLAGCGSGGGGGGGRIVVYYGAALSWTGGALTPANATAHSGGGGSANGTVIVSHYGYAFTRSITMSTAAPSATSVSYTVTFTPEVTAPAGGIVVDICDNDPVIGDASCTFPTGFDWGGATPTLAGGYSGMGSGWTVAGVQGGAGSGKSQVLELSNATPQSLSSSTPVSFTITSVANPSTANHSFYARLLTFDTSANMTSQYTVAGTARSGSYINHIDFGGMALSTSNAIVFSFTVPEALTFCVSGTSIGANCSGTSAPNLILGHGGPPKILNSSAVDTANAYVQTSTNALSGVAVSMKSTNSGVVVAGGGPAGTNYAQSIVIDNTANANTLTNYQVAVTVNTASLIASGQMRSDCGDVRFRNSDNATDIPNYWVENCNNASTKIWVKVPSISGSVKKTIYLYYGAPGATTLSSVTNTFIRDISGIGLAYRFDEATATNAVDYSGNSLTGTSTGTAVVAGEFNNARSFNGSSDNVSVPASALLNNSVFTLSAWINPSNISTTSRQIFGPVNATGGIEFRVQQTTGKLELLKEGIVSIGTSTGTVSISTWTHVAVTYDGSGNYKFYINGSLSGSGTNLQAFVFNHFFVGAGRNGELFAGNIDEPRIYNRVLTGAEISDEAANYGYATPNYAGHELIRQFSSPEPTVSNIVACAGLSQDGGLTCGIPAVNTSCGGSCSATTISAGTAAIGMCVLPGSGSITAIAPYNGASCGSGTTYGLDDATASGAATLYGSPIFSGTGPFNAESDTLTFAATAAVLTPGGTYKGNYSLIATGTF